MPSYMKKVLKRIFPEFFMLLLELFKLVVVAVFYTLFMVFLFFAVLFFMGMWIFGSFVLILLFLILLIFKNNNNR